MYSCYFRHFRCGCALCTQNIHCKDLRQDDIWRILDAKIPSFFNNLWVGFITQGLLKSDHIAYKVYPVSGFSQLESSIEECHSNDNVIEEKQKREILRGLKKKYDEGVLTLFLFLSIAIHKIASKHGVSELWRWIRFI